MALSLSKDKVEIFYEIAENNKIWVKTIFDASLTSMHFLMQFFVNSANAFIFCQTLL